MKTTYEKIKEINNHVLEELYLTVENGCASDIELKDIDKLVEFIYFLYSKRENLYKENNNLKMENKLLRYIIIEKEKERYNK